MPATRLTRLIFLLGLLLWLAITLPSLTRYPTPHADESWLSQPALDFFDRGRFGLIHMPDFVGSSESYIIGRSFSVLVGLGYATMGLGLWQGRLLSTFGVLLGSAIMYRLGGRLYGRWLGLAAGLLYLFAWRVLFAGHFIRPEVWVISAGMGLVLGLWQVRQRQLKTAAVRGYFALGLLSAAALDIYPSFAFHAVAIGAHVVLLNWRRKDWLAVGWFTGGGVLGTALVVAIQVWPLGFRQVLAQWQYAATNIYDFSGTVLIPIIGPLVNLVSQYGSLYFSSTRLSWIELAYVVLAISVVIARRADADRFVLVASGLYFVALGYIARGLNYTHMVNLTPWFVLLVTGGLDGLSRFIQPRLLRLASWGSPVVAAHWFPAALGLPLLGAFAVGTAVLSYRGATDTTAEDYAARLQALFPAQVQGVFGDAALWPYLKQYPYTYDLALTVLPRPVTEAQAQSVTETLIAERQISTLLLKVPLLGNTLGQEGPIYWNAVLAYAEANCEMRGEVSGRNANFEVMFDPNYVTRVYECKAAP